MLPIDFLRKKMKIVGFVVSLQIFFKKFVFAEIFVGQFFMFYVTFVTIAYFD